MSAHASPHQIGQHGRVRRGDVHRSEADEFTKPFGSPRYVRWSSVFFCAFIVVVAGGALISHLTHDVGGDPGGRIMAVLAQTDVAIPPDAAIEYRRDDRPLWSSCDGREGTEGWADVVFTAHFASSLSSSEILARADDALTAQGWARTRLLEDSEAAWITTQRSTTARATLRREYYDDKWTLLATAPPEGRRASGC